MVTETILQYEILEILCGSKWVKMKHLNIRAPEITTHKKLSFRLRISLGNVNKSAFFRLYKHNQNYLMVFQKSRRKRFFLKEEPRSSFIFGKDCKLQVLLIY